MKKLLLIAAISSIVSTSTDMYAGNTAKKIWAGFKIFYGVSSGVAAVCSPIGGLITLSSVNNMAGQSLNVNFNMLKYSLKKYAKTAISAGPFTYLPLAVLCVKSGLRDFKKLKKSDIHVSV